MFSDSSASCHSSKNGGSKSVAVSGSKGGGSNGSSPSSIFRLVSRNGAEAVANSWALTVIVRSGARTAKAGLAATSSLVRITNCCGTLVCAPRLFTARARGQSGVVYVLTYTRRVKPYFVSFAGESLCLDNAGSARRSNERIPIRLMCSPCSAHSLGLPSSLVAGN